MKKVLKSFVVMMLAIVVGAGSTGAYFTSTVTAANNQIVAGTLLLEVATAQDASFPGVGVVSWGTSSNDAWPVAYQSIDGTVTNSETFIPWIGAAPGDTHAYSVGVRNLGSVPAQFRASATGRWVSGPRFGGPLCVGAGVGGADVLADATGSNPALVSVTNVHQYPSANCEGAFGCLNLYYSGGAGYDGVGHEAGLASADAVPGAFYYGTTDGSGTQAGPRFELGQNEFAIYRVDVGLNGPDTNDCYQGATYTFDLTVQGKQAADSAW